MPWKSQGVSCCVAFHFKFTFNCRSVVAGIKFRVPIFGSIAWKYVNADIFRLSIAMEARIIKKKQNHNKRKAKGCKKRRRQNKEGNFLFASRSQDTLLDNWLSLLKNRTKTILIQLKTIRRIYVKLNLAEQHQLRYIKSIYPSNQEHTLPCKSIDITRRSWLTVKKANKPKLTLMGFEQTTRQARERRKQAVERLTARVSIQIEKAYSRPLFLSPLWLSSNWQASESCGVLQTFNWNLALGFMANKLA